MHTCSRDIESFVPVQTSSTMKLFLNAQRGFADHQIVSMSIVAELKEQEVVGSREK